MTTTAEDANTPPFDWNGYMVQRWLDSEEWEDFLYEPVSDQLFPTQLTSTKENHNESLQHSRCSAVL